jgi:hypothetical protein
MADRSGTPPGTLQYSECQPWAVVESFSVPLGVWRPPLHLRHCVELHWRRHCGHTPPVFECVPLGATRTKAFVLFAGRPAAERAADSWRFRRAGIFFFLKLAVWSNCGSISRWTHLFGSLNYLVFDKAAPILPITRTSLPRKPAYLIAMPRSMCSASW